MELNINNNHRLLELDLKDGFRCIIITSDEGYKPMMECRDMLINDLGFTLISEYGLTDMVYDLSYNNKQYSLKYFGLDDLISFETVINNDEELKIFRMAANHIINERDKKRIDDKTKK